MVQVLHFLTGTQRLHPAGLYVRHRKAEQRQQAKEQEEWKPANRSKGTR